MIATALSQALGGSLVVDRGGEQRPLVPLECPRSPCRGSEQALPRISGQLVPGSMILGPQ